MLTSQDLSGIIDTQREYAAVLQRNAEALPFLLPAFVFFFDVFATMDVLRGSNLFLLSTPKVTQPFVQALQASIDRGGQ